MANRVYKDSPFGEAVYPHLNTPDTGKQGVFTREPLFSTGLRLPLDGPGGPLMEEVRAASDKALADFFESEAGQKIPPNKRKDWKAYYPFEEEFDDAGNPKGTVVFDFKQNAGIKSRETGEVKKVFIAIYDAAGKLLNKLSKDGQQVVEPAPLVRNGSIIRVNHTMRPITMKSTTQVGVRLDFGRVQVRTWAEASGGGFGAVDGDEAPEGGFAPADQGGSAGADY